MVQIRVQRFVLLTRVLQMKSTEVCIGNKSGTNEGGLGRNAKTADFEYMASAGTEEIQSWYNRRAVSSKIVQKSSPGGVVTGFWWRYRTGGQHLLTKDKRTTPWLG